MANLTELMILLNCARRRARPSAPGSDKIGRSAPTGILPTSYSSIRPAVID